MDINKATWSMDKSNMRMSMPISKVDVEKRTVSGFATLDNIDKQGDIVPADASLKAFERFRGNIREMHQPIAAGKLISFKEEKYYDAETAKEYSGIFVSAYISKGAQDTWEKVLDGTLTGFSIGGEINKSEDAYDENIGESIRVIKDYDLIELSIVDNPANQYANVFSIEKGQASGLAVDTQIESIYYCADDNLVQLSQDSNISCPKCDSGMESIGFVESNDVDKADVIKSILSTVKSEKEVSKMEENTTETVEKADEAPVVEVADPNGGEAITIELEETAKAEEEAEVEKAEEEEEAVEKAEVAEEAPSQEADVEKADVPAEVISEIAETTKASMEEMTKTVSILADTVKALNSKVEELNKQVTGVRSEMAEDKSEFGKRVTAVEKETAFRKSGDLGQVVQEPIKVEKARAQSLWGGRFLTTDLFN
jgi:hypothetical protein